jgi:hypothetical protein
MASYLSHDDRSERRKNIAKYAAEHGAAAASQAHKVSLSTVWSACKEFSVKPARAARDYTAPSTMQILKALLDGEKQTDVATRFRLSRQRVHQIRCSAIEAGFSFPVGE